MGFVPHVTSKCMQQHKSTSKAPGNSALLAVSYQRDIQSFVGFVDTLEENFYKAFMFLRLTNFQTIEKKIRKNRTTWGNTTRRVPPCAQIREINVKRIVSTRHALSTQRVVYVLSIFVQTIHSTNHFPPRTLNILNRHVQVFEACTYARFVLWFSLAHDECYLILHCSNLDYVIPSYDTKYKGLLY